MESMYQTLMELPLFHGVSYQRLSEIVGSYPLHFIKYTPGQTIVRRGEQCTHINSIVSGGVRFTITSADGRFRVSQTLEAPDVIAPDFFFGRNTTYPGDAVSVGNVGIMQIEKHDYLRIANSDEVLLYNFLNILSMNAQLSTEGVLAITSGSLEKRIAYWIVALTQSGGKEITMECRQRDMYAVFGVPRQSLVAALDGLQRQGALTYAPNIIKVLDRRVLLGVLGL